MNQSFRLEKPSSPKAVELVWEAYDAIPEREKKNILKVLQKRNPTLFASMVKHAGFPRGAMVNKIANREIGYGRIVDKFLRTQDGGTFGEEVLFKALHLMKGGIAAVTLGKLQGSKSSKEARKRLNAMMKDEGQNPMIVLSVRFFEAFINFDGNWLQNFGEQQESANDGDGGEPNAEDAGDNGSRNVAMLASCGDDQGAEDNAEESGTATLDTDCRSLMDEAIDEVLDLAESARAAGPWDESKWDAATDRAKDAVTKVRREVERMAMETGQARPTWETREALDEVFKSLRQAGDGKARLDKLVEFLRGLAEDIRALRPLHKLPSKRKQQASMKDAAADEIALGYEEKSIKWPHGGPQQPREWLQWVRQLDGQGLEKLIEDLGEASFPHTAILVEDLDRNYEPGDVGATMPAEEVLEVKKAAVIITAEPRVLPSAAPLLHPEIDPTPRKKNIPQRGSKRGIKQSKESPATTASQAPPQNTDSNSAALNSIAKNPELEAAPAEIPIASEVPEAASSAAVTVTVGDRIGKINEEPFPNDEFDASSDLEDIGSLNESAATALAATETEVEAAIEKVVWNLLASGERTLAFQILNEARQTGLMDAFPVPPHTLEIIALLPAYSSSSSEVPHHIRMILQTEDFSGIFKVGESRANLLRRLLLGAALLRPALFDPSSNAGTILEAIHFENTGLRKITHALAEFGRKGVEINATILSAILNAQGWKEGEDKIVEEIRSFQSNAANRNMNYAPATWIWRHWVQGKNGWMRNLFALATSHERKSLESLAAALENCDLNAEITKGWEESNGRGILVGTALGSLHRLANEALDLVRRRLDHWKSGSQGDGDYRQKVLEQLAATVFQNIPSAREELRTLLSSGSAEKGRIGIAAELMLAEIEQLNDALSGANTYMECANLDEWLKADLLRLETIKMDESMQVDSSQFQKGDGISDFWMEIDTARSRLARELQALCKPVLRWRQAFDAAITRYDHRAARWILDQMSRAQVPGLPDLESRKSDDAAETRNRLRRDINSVEAKLGYAFTKGWLTPEVHIENLALVHRMLEELSDKHDWQDQPFHTWFEDLSNVTKKIDLAHNEQVKTAELSLKALHQATPNEIDRVKRVLAKGDVLLASEYIQKIQASEGIDEPEEVNEMNHFAKLFGEGSDGGYFNALFDCLSGTFDPSKVIADIQSSDTWCGIELRKLEPTLRSTSASAMQRWFGLLKTRKMDEKALEVILRAFELPVSSVTHNRDGFLVNLVADSPCPIPDFGSEIRSRKISVNIDFQRSSVDDMVQYLERMKSGMAPTILLWMRPIPIHIRRKFSRLCRQKSMKVLMIDTVLASYVLSVESPRVRALFECGLPFTNVAPYATTGGMLPEEMFYGRRREIEAIESAGQSGTCFVYGGRQIGKTVLLRKVERDFPKRGKQHVALYLDLNFHAVGQTVSMDEIWRIVADELSKKDPTIFGKTNRTQFTVDNFASHVKDWLNQDEERRILLLLDEADRFLQSDGDAGDESGMPFKICLKLKGLMDDTLRRFKVVFAGLHNVQRSTRVANNPLAQLGMPVCVGPLYQNGESREAANLVAIPLSASGVIFDSADTINTILARTNYYPNLIQILCSRLLSLTIDKQSRSNPDHTPPFLVTSEDVESVFAKHEIRDEIRKKFMLTLDLDRRFSLIAHHMAFLANTNPNGFTVDDIQRDAVAWWPAGFKEEGRKFKDSLHEDISVLLNEMRGLGILRRDATDRFFLRSPNVVALLGTPREIEHVLESASNWESSPPYSPDSFRTPTPGQDDHFHWRSCLTARQEALIRDPNNQVVVISGCRASGINEVEDCLRSLLGHDYLISFSESSHLSGFEKSFGKLTSREKEAGKTVILVPASSAWNLNWIESAKRLLGRFTAKDRPVGVVFLADSNLVWELLPEWKAILREAGPTKHIRLLRWDRVSLRQWLTDSGIHLDHLSRIDHVSAGWHEAIHILGSFYRGGGASASQATTRERLFEVLGMGLSLKQSFGFPDALAIQAFEIIAQLGEPVTDVVLHELYNGQLSTNESKKIAPSLEWAEALGIAERTEHGWVLDELVGDLIKANIATP